MEQTNTPKRPRNQLEKIQAELRAKGFVPESFTRFDSAVNKYFVSLPGTERPMEFTPEGKYLPPGARENPF